MRVVVGMSGGVDSSVAAALLQQQGHEVIGATLVLAAQSQAVAGADVPVSVEAARSARAVCDHLGLEWHEIERRALFADRVIAPFCDEYVRGRTPNPCVVCNRAVKFPVLIETARSLGADTIATGHYARILRGNASVVRANDRVVLRRGLDKAKDQSYALFGLDPAVLASVLMPLGELHKTEVQRLAASLGLPAHDRPASQDVCFVPDGDYAKLLCERTGSAPALGPIYDVHGNLLGEHKGIGLYTVGQRRGLGIGAREPLYVVEIDAAHNALIVGRDDDLMAGALVAHAPSWLSIDPPIAPFDALVKIRYNHAGTAAAVTPLDEEHVRVDFHEPVRAVTPGQACVFYGAGEGDRDLVLGGAWIERKAAS